MMWDFGLLLVLSMDLQILTLLLIQGLECLLEQERWYTKPSNNLSTILIKLLGILTINLGHRIKDAVVYQHPIFGHNENDLSIE